MSATIDNRIVEMRFNNENFEKNVEQSMRTLDNLDKSLGQLSSDANFKDLSKNVESVSDRFSKWGIVAGTAIQNLTNRAIDFVTDGLGAIKDGISTLTFDPLREGFGKYEQELLAIQKISNADWSLTNDQIYEELEKIQWFADETSYDYSTMIDTVSNMMSYGTSLSDSIDIIQGVGNIAGLVGSSVAMANHGFEGFARAMGSGFMSTQNWRTWIRTANMNSQIVKQMFLDAAVDLGTIEEVGDGVYKSLTGIGKAEEFTIGSMDDMLTKNRWLTDDVMAYVFKDMNSYTKIIQSFQRTYGELTGEIITASEAMDLYDDTSNLSSKKVQAYIATHEELYGTVISEAEAIEILSNVTETAASRGLKAGQEYRSLTDAINATKDAASSTWKNIFKVVFGEVEESKDLWGEVGETLFDEFVEPLKTAQEIIEKVFWDWSGRDDFLQGLRNIVTGLLDVLHTIGEAFSDVFGVKTFGGNVALFLRSLITRFKNFTASIKPSEEALETFKKVLSDILTPIRSVFGLLKSVFNILSPIVQTIFKVLGYVLKAISPVFRIVGAVIDAIAAVNNKIADAIKWLLGLGDEAKPIGSIFEFVGSIIEKVSDWIVNCVNTIVDVMDDLFGWFINTPVAKAIAGTFSTIKGIFGDLFINLSDTAKKVSSVKDFFNAVLHGLAEVVRTFGKIIGAIFGIDLTDPIENYIITPVRNAKNALVEWIKNTDFAGEFTKRLGNLKSVASEFKDNMSEIFAGVSYAEGGGGFSGVVESIFDGVVNVVRLAGNSFGAIIGKDFRQGIEDNIVVPIQTARDKVVDFLQKNGILESLQKLKDKLVELWKIVCEFIGANYAEDNIFVILWKGLKKLWEILQPVFGVLKETLGYVWNWIKENIHPAELLKAIFDAIGTALKTVGEHLRGAFGENQTVWDVLKNVLGLLKDAAKIGIGGGLIKFLFTLSSGVKDWSGIGVSLKKMFDSITSASTNLTKNFKANRFKSIAAAILMLVGAIFLLMFIPIGDLLKGLAVITVLGAIIVAINRLVADDKETKGVAGRIVAMGMSMLVIILALTWAIKAIIKATNGSEDAIWIVVAVLGGFAFVFIAMGVAMNFAGKAGENAVKNFKQARKTLKSMAASFILMGIAIAALAVALKIFDKVNDLDKALKGFIATLATITLAMTFTGAITKTFKFEFASLKKVVDAFMGMAKVMVVLAAALFIFSKIENMDKAIEGFAVTIGTVLIAIVLLQLETKKLGASAKNFQYIGIAFVAIAIAMVILAGALKFFDTLDEKTFWGNFLKLAACLALLGAAIWAMGKAVGKSKVDYKALGIGFAAIAGGLVLLAVALHIIGSMPFGDLVQGLIGVALALGIFLAGAWLIGKMEKPLKKGVKVIKELGLGFVFLGAGMWLIAKVITLVAGALPEFINAITEVGLAIIAMIPKIIVAIAQGLLDALPILSELLVNLIKTAIGTIGSHTVELAKTFIDIIIAILDYVLQNIHNIIDPLIEILVTTFSELAAHTDEFIGPIGEIIDGITSLGLIDTAEALLITGALTVLFGEMLLMTTAAWAATSMLPQIGDNLTLFMMKALPFFSTVQMLGPGVAESCESIARAILAMTAASLIDGVLSFFGAKIDFIPLGEQLVGFAPYLKDFADIMKDVDADQLAKLGLAMEAIAHFADMAPTSGNEGVLDKISEFFAGSDSLENFGKELVAFGPYIKQFAEQVRDISAEDVKGAAAAGQVMAEMADNIPNSGGVWADFFGDNTMDKFGNELASFGKSLVSFIDTVKDVKPTDVDAATNCAKILSKMADNIPNSGGVWGAFFGDNTMDVFGTQLESFGTSLVKFIETIRDVKPTDVDAAVACGNLLSDMASNIPNSGGVVDFFTGSNDMDEFGIQLEAYGNSLKNFAAIASTIPDVDIKRAITMGDLVVDMANKIPYSGGLLSKFLFGDKDMEEFGDALGDFASGIVDFTTNIKGLSPLTEDTVTAVQNVVESMGSIMKAAQGVDKFNNLVRLGKAIYDSFIDAFSGTQVKTKLQTAIKEFFKTLISNTLC